MTDDQIWERSSIGERLDILRIEIAREKALRRLKEENAENQLAISKPSSSTVDVRFIISANEYDRLVRVERAGQSLANCDFTLNGQMWPRAMRLVNELREVLKP